MASPLPIRSFRGKPCGSRFSSSPFSCSYAGSSPPGSPPRRDLYLTLGVTFEASVNDIKKAYRRLALKYHPDVCKGESCSRRFVQINGTYETIMGFLEGNNDVGQQHFADPMAPEPMMGVYDESWDEWEEWMGWEGAGTRDYSSHVNHSL